jgi:hypothetical protein
MPVRTDISVVFPAPFGPSNPKISFGFKASENDLRAM